MADSPITTNPQAGGVISSQLERDEITRINDLITQASTDEGAATALATTVAGKVSKDAPIFNALDHGLKGDGTQESASAIIAWVTAAAAVKGVCYMPYTSAGYLLGRSTTGVQMSGGIPAQNGVTFKGDNTKLLLSADTPFFNVESTRGTPSVITADTAITDSTLTVDSTASLSVGQDVLVEIGQASYDAGEPDWWFFAKVATVNSSTSVTLDRTVNYALSVAATTNTAHRSIYPITSIVENVTIDGFNMVNTTTGGANAEAGVRAFCTRSLRIGKLAATNPGPGIISLQYVEDWTADVLRVDGSISQDGNASKGRGIELAECRNGRIGIAHLKDCSNSFLTAESRVENVVVESLRIDNGLASRNASQSMLTHLGNSAVIYDDVHVTGNTAVFYNSSGGTNPISIRRANFWTNADPSIQDMSIFDSVRVRGYTYSEKKRYSRTVALTPSMSATVITLPAGIVRKARVYASSLTGLTALYLSNGTTNGSNQVGNLTAGATVLMGAAKVGLGASGAGYDFNQYEPKRLVISTDGTVPTGAYLTVELDMFVAQGVADDGGQARVDIGPTTTSSSTSQYVSFYDSGYTKTDGTTITTTDSGITLSQKANPSGVAPSWAGGQLVNPTGTGGAANYATANLGAVVNMIEQEITFTLQAADTYPKASYGVATLAPTDFGEGTLVIWDQDIATTFPAIPNARAHCPMTREFFQYDLYYGSRSVTDGVTNGTATLTSATAAFTSHDVGSPINGTNIPGSSYIGVVNSATSIGLSSSATTNTPISATGSGSSGTLNLGGPVAIIPVNGNSTSYYFEKPLVADGVTVHHSKIYFPRPDTAIVKLPDGKVLIYKDARIASFAGNFACYEHYQTNAATDSLVGYTYRGASTAPQGAQAPGSTEVEDRAEAERQGSRAFGKVTTLWYTRNDAATTTTSGSAVVTDAAILAADLWKPITGTGIPTSSYVGTVTPGVGFRLSSTQFLQTDVTATASGTVTAAIGGVTLAVGTSYTDVGGLWVTAPYIPLSGRLLFTASVFLSMPTTGTRVLLGIRKASSGTLLYGEAVQDTNTFVGQVVHPILITNLAPSLSPVTFVLQADAVAAGDATIKIASGGFAGMLSVEPA